MTSLAKMLKRKVSRVHMEAPKTTSLDVAVAAIVEEAEERKHNGDKDESSKTSGGNTETSSVSSASNASDLNLQYGYGRPSLLGTVNLKSALDPRSRPVLTAPGDADLPSGIGYAEATNAGKSRFNEDQAAVVAGSLSVVGTDARLPYVYAGIFDGHGGFGAALKASHELHAIIHESLDDVLVHIIAADKEECDYNNNDKKAALTDGLLVSEDSDDDTDDDDGCKPVKMTADELIVGALESSFWAMDQLIAKDKNKWRIPGGATALAALFIRGKLYVANAGDSRAIVCSAKEQPHSMSKDFTPESDRQRIQMIAFQRPELLRHPSTREKLYNRHMLAQKPSKETLDSEETSTVLYRDYYMSGWSCREVTADDVNLQPLIAGRGKLCRLMGTVGVARGLGDHDLLAKGSHVRCKEFLTSQPEVQMIDLRANNHAGDRFLVMATDGLWDVMSNERVSEEVRLENLESKHVIGRETAIAARLVDYARGRRCADGRWEMPNERLASGDDISCIVINIEDARRDLIRN